MALSALSFFVKQLYATMTAAMDLANKAATVSVLR